MRNWVGLATGAGLLLIGLAVAETDAQRLDAFVESRDHAAIGYSRGTGDGTVEALNARLATAAARITFHPESGYLLPILDALSIPAESQTLVFSQTSAQASHISPENPRAIYFNDRAAVGWVPGATDLEIAVHDSRQGAMFFTVGQRAADVPRLKREDGCLQCHLAWETLGVPGMMTLSTFQMPDDPNAYASGVSVDHRTPFADRWGGWYVTGRLAAAHRGNVPVVVDAETLRRGPGPTPVFETLAGRFKSRGYPGPCSDVAALLVLNHQTRMTNLLTRLGWEARVALPRTPSPSPPDATAIRAPSRRVEEAVRDLVDYLFFVDEAPLPGPVQASCGFAQRFQSTGPRDRSGRSLRDLDLTRRLMRYPSSYMIDSPAFAALPAPAKAAVHERMWRVLSGGEQDTRFAHLTRTDRQAIVEILRDTQRDLPPYFGGAVR